MKLQIGQKNVIRPVVRHSVFWPADSSKMDASSNAAIEKAIVAAADDLGYPNLKNEQLKVVTAFMQGRDVFAVLPTGYGKSLCFGCLPLAFDKLSAESSQPSAGSIVVVVTPLTAIMKDQVCLK